LNWIGRHFLSTNVHVVLQPENLGRASEMYAFEQQEELFQLEVLNVEFWMDNIFF